MSVEEIKEAICEYFNTRKEFEGVPFICYPTNASAPVGKYIAVGITGVKQYGSKMQIADSADYFEYVATGNLFEVEGSGDTLRSVLNILQTQDFAIYAWEHGFTVWGINSIQSVDSLDGDFYVRQFQASFEINFEDKRETVKSTIETVDIELKQGEK